MATLEKHVIQRAGKGLKNPMKMANKDTQTEGMAKQMDYSAQSNSKRDTAPRTPKNGAR